MKVSKIMIAATLMRGLLFSPVALADSDDRWFSWGEGTKDVAPVENTLYQNECGSCHMAYQPGFLPSRSWQSLMGNLADHFNENAELDDQTRQQLTQYLVDNAADKVNYKRSNGMMRSLSYNETPLRISGTRYFMRKHNELPRRVVENNPRVKSFSRCEVCHAAADKGSYNEHQVRIPGYGRWDD